MGCDNLCFNKFSKISHIRFWAFQVKIICDITYSIASNIDNNGFIISQILAVATPTILFHFYAMNVTGKIENLKLIEDELRKAEEGLVNNLRVSWIKHRNGKGFSSVYQVSTDTQLASSVLITYNSTQEKDIRHHPKKKNHLGKVKTKKVYDGNQLKEVFYLLLALLNNQNEDFIPSSLYCQFSRLFFRFL